MNDNTVIPQRQKLVNWFIPTNINNSSKKINTLNLALRYVLLTTIGILLLTLSAKINVPSYPARMTMQTYMVFLLALVYGSRLAMVTLLTYMAIGLMGVAVFSGTPDKGIGWLYMSGPTGGYLLGFVIATFIIGKMADIGWSKSFLKSILILIVGEIIIIALGVLWLGQIIGWDKPVLEVGAYPFLLGDFMKIILAAVTTTLIWKTIDKIQHFNSDSK